MDKNAKIYIAGHRGLVGSSIWRTLESRGYTNLIGRTRAELDLTRQSDVADFFAAEKPEYVFLAAAKVGGIHANNTYPAEFAYSNLQIQNNIVESSYQTGAKKLLFLGSSCIYPRMAQQPMQESELLAGKLEPTNEPYALSKIAGIIMCQSYNRQYGTNYISIMPTNLYGPGDNYHPENSHVIPGMMRRIHEAKLNGTPEVVIWGSGKPMREFLYVDDMADASVFMMNNYDGNDIINVGTGVEISIRELAETMVQVVGYTGTLTFDTSKPDGTPRKLLDVSRIHELGWKHQVNLREGLEKTYAAFLRDVIPAESASAV